MVPKSDPQNQINSDKSSFLICLLYPFLPSHQPSIAGVGVYLYSPSIT